MLLAFRPACRKVHRPFYYLQHPLRHVQSPSRLQSTTSAIKAGLRREERPEGRNRGRGVDNDTRAGGASRSSFGQADVQNGRRNKSSLGRETNSFASSSKPSFASHGRSFTRSGSSFEREGRASARSGSSFEGRERPFARTGPSSGREDRSFTRSKPSSGREERAFSRSSPPSAIRRDALRERGNSPFEREDRRTERPGRSTQSRGYEKSKRPSEGRDPKTWERTSTHGSGVREPDRAFERRDWDRPARFSSDNGQKTAFHREDKRSIRNDLATNVPSGSRNRNEAFEGAKSSWKQQNRLPGTYEHTPAFETAKGNDLGIDTGRGKSRRESIDAGEVWAMPLNARDVEAILATSERITDKQYRASITILEKSLEEHTQGPSTKLPLEEKAQRQIRHSEALLEALEAEWLSGKSDSAKVLQKSQTSGSQWKEEMENKVHDLLVRLPLGDHNRRRWYHGIATRQLKRGVMPRKLSAPASTDRAIEEAAANQVRNDIEESVDQLIKGLPDEDSDGKKYQTLLKFCVKMREERQRPDKVKDGAQRERHGLKDQAVVTEAEVDVRYGREIRTTTAFVEAADKRGKRLKGEHAVQKDTREDERSSSITHRGDRLALQQRSMALGSPSAPEARVASSAEADADDNAPISVPYSAAASTFLYGSNAVLAALRAKRRTLYHLHTAESDHRNSRVSEDKHTGASTIANIIALAKSAAITIDFNTSTRMLDKMSDSRPHNGVVLEASHIPSPPVLSLAFPQVGHNAIPLNLSPQSKEEAAVNGTPSSIPCASLDYGGRQPLVVLLDGITDPGNLGNILRSAHFYGVDAVAIATNTCASLNLATLAKASSGACESVQILSLPKPANFVAETGRAGWRIYAAVAPPSGHIGDRTPPAIKRTTTRTLGSPLDKRPVLLMLGAEGEGLRANLANKADYWLSIEQSQSGGLKGASAAVDVGVESLNVAVAAGVLMERFLRVETIATNTAAPRPVAKLEKDKAGEAGPKEFGVDGGLGF